MPHVITSKCQRLGDCLPVCPVEAIVPGPKGTEWADAFFIDPDKCVDCGACASVCNENAIFSDMDVPAANKADIARNAKFFTSGPGHWDFDLQKEIGK